MPLALDDIPIWMPTMPPIYDIDKSYLENADEGPFFKGAIPFRQWTNKTQWLDFLGYRIASPLGVPAGPLLNSRWIELAANLGFDVVCYKTIRSKLHHGHPPPNVIYIENEEQFNPQNLPKFVQKLDALPKNLECLAITNSFGMPSRSPEYLLEDIPLANSCLHKGQVMIVSIVGTCDENEPGSFEKDFVETAVLAKECGAHIIEANFSCPNVTTGEGCVYYNPKSVYAIASQIVKAINPIPLIIKLGLFPNQQGLKETLVSAAKAGVRGISGINTISMNVLTKDGKHALGQSRKSSGICGSPIREAALDFIRQAREINDREKLNFAILGCGGITLPEHFSLFLNAGADIAMSATGMMWDPYIAFRYHEKASKSLKGRGHAKSIIN